MASQIPPSPDLSPTNNVPQRPTINPSQSHRYPPTSVVHESPSIEALPLYSLDHVPCYPEPPPGYSLNSMATASISRGAGNVVLGIPFNRLGSTNIPLNLPVIRRIRATRGQMVPVAPTVATPWKNFLLVIGCCLLFVVTVALTIHLFNGRR